MIAIRLIRLCDSSPYHYMTFDHQPSSRIFAIGICIPVCQCCNDYFLRSLRQHVVFVVSSWRTIVWKYHHNGRAMTLWYVTRYHDDFTHACKSPPVSSYVGSPADQTARIYSGRNERERERERDKKEKKNSPCLQTRYYLSS